MIITDTHAHLYLEQFDKDRKEMMQRAFDKGVTRFFIPAIDSSYTQAMLDLERQFRGHIFLMIGLHPTYVNGAVKEELEHVEKWLGKRKFYALGEIGMDLYWDKTHLKEQQYAFRKQLRWAKKYRLPVVIHCREAFDETIEIIQEEKNEKLKGIFHCFTGTREQAQQLIDCNMKLGIGGVVTFKNGGLDKFLDQISLEHIVLETDAPYLAPVPYRGKRNESSYIIRILEKIADIYGLAPEEVARTTTQNSKQVFGV